MAKQNDSKPTQRPEPKPREEKGRTIPKPPVRPVNPSKT
jgi:hypothetical protein